MAIYLSAGMTEELQERLIKGGYDRETPAAVVYKATWPEEKSLICTVGTLADTAKAHDISKIAVILVGDAVTHSKYEKSRLYSSDFSTEFRKAVPKEE